MSGADVGVRVGSVVVRIEVEQAMVIVAVIVAADVQHVRASVRVHGPKKPARCAQIIPKELYCYIPHYAVFGRK